MKVTAKFDEHKRILYIYVNGSLTKKAKIEFEERNIDSGYFKYKRERYDFMFERNNFLNKTSYDLWLYPVNAFKDNRVRVKVTE